MGLYHAMNDEYWMFTASILYFVCYVPELYANYRNRNANLYNVPEKIVMTVATGCALVYAIRTDNVPLMTNYAPLMALDIVATGMRVYYAWKTHKKEPGSASALVAVEDATAALPPV
jgi:hypothetical protein